MTATKAISVLLVDDSELVRAGLKALLDLHSDDAGARLERSSARPTPSPPRLTEVKRLNPDVVLLDIRLPDGSGLDACRQILQLELESKVLILTSVIDDSLVYDAMSSGAHGYLLKEINAQGLCQGRSTTSPAASSSSIPP